MSRASVPHRWGVILAGGEGARLRPLTRTLAGDDRPKQFCAILGDTSLLEGTRRRVMLGVAPQRTLVMVTRTQERFYVPALASMRTGAVVVQPENRGTAPAVLYALLRLTTLAPRDRVAFFPADHHVSDDRAFMSHVDAAFEASAERCQVREAAAGQERRDQVHARGERDVRHRVRHEGRRSAAP